jgi:hypothetical protein
MIGPAPSSTQIGWQGKENDGYNLFDANHAAQYAALLRPTRAICRKNHGKCYLLFHLIHS